MGVSDYSDPVRRFGIPPTTYDVSCSACSLSTELEDVDAVFDLQAEHQERLGDHHVLEFDRLAASDGGEDQD